jgi:hypothetical protein
MEARSLLPLDYRIEIYCPLCNGLLTVGFPVICEECNNDKYFSSFHITSIMKKFMKFLDTKTLIIDAIKNRLDGENIEKIHMIFSISDDRYSVSLKQLDSDKRMNYNVNPEDISFIKKMFVSKILKTLDNSENYKAIILQIDLELNKFDIFLQDKKDDVTLYEFFKTN